MYSTMILVFLGLKTTVSIESSSKDLYIFNSFPVLHDTEFFIYIQVPPVFALLGENS